MALTDESVSSRLTISGVLLITNAKCSLFLPASIVSMSIIPLTLKFPTPELQICFQSVSTISQHWHWSGINTISAFGFFINFKVASITSLILWGGTLICFPNAIPNVPLISNNGNIVGRYSGSTSSPE